MICDCIIGKKKREDGQAGRLLDVDQLDVKGQGRVGGNTGDLLRSVSEGSGDL